MAPDEEKLAALFNKQLNGTISASEKEELAFYAMRKELQPLLEQLISESWHITGEEDDIPESKGQAIQDYILQEKISQPVSMTINIKLRWWWAAAALFFITGSMLLYFKPWQANTVSTATHVQTEIGPGSLGAVLTLSDGRRVILDSVISSTIADNHGVTAVVNNGKLQYKNESSEESNAIAYHTVATPRGKQFRLVLSDGTRVWLNAASSITYPTRFTGGVRKVSITGEVYFEAETKSATNPFIVASREQLVTVLGTHFNINSYDDANLVKTTLCEGKVKITPENGASDKILNPGEQSLVGPKSKLMVKQVEASQAIAWQMGYFNFSNTPFAEIMQQLSRWYNIDIKYQHTIPNIEFEGRLNQSVKLSRVLEFLKESGIQFSITDHTLTIL